MDLSNIKQEKRYVAFLTAIQFFNILDFVILLPLGPSLMRYFGIGPSEFSLLASSYSFSAAISGVIYSLIADKIDRKKFLVFLTTLFIVSTLFCAFAPSFLTLLFARSFAGFFAGVITPVIYAIIADLIPYQRRGKAVGTIMASFSMASILGIPIGLAIADMTNWRNTFYFICIGGSLALLFNLLYLPSVPVNGTKESVKENLLRLVRIAFKAKFFPSYLLMFLFTSSGFLLFPFLSPYGVKNVGILETDLKYIYLVGGLFTVITSRVAGSFTDTYGGLKTFIPGVLISVPFTYLYTSVEHISLFTLLIISTGFMVFINFRFVPVMTFITQTPSTQERGSFMGILLSVRSLATALATSFSGLFISENELGKIINFDKMGILSIVLSLTGGILFYTMYIRKEKENYGKLNHTECR